jgi:hypothetical protein
LKIGQLFGTFEDILGRWGVDGIEDEDEDRDEVGEVT